MYFLHVVLVCIKQLRHWTFWLLNFHLSSKNQVGKHTNQHACHFNSLIILCNSLYRFLNLFAVHKHERIFFLAIKCMMRAVIGLDKLNSQSQMIFITFEYINFFFHQKIQHKLVLNNTNEHFGKTIYDLRFAGENKKWTPHTSICSLWVFYTYVILLLVIMNVCEL